MKCTGRKFLKIMLLEEQLLQFIILNHSLQDIDIFFIAPEKEGLILLTPFYEFLLKKGYKTYKEYIMIEDMPIQFIPAIDNLEREAVENSIPVNYKEVEVKIFRAEYLIAIFLRVYRPKDREKIIKLLEQAKIDKDFLMDILKKHNLDEKFKEFMKVYYG